MISKANLHIKNWFAKSFLEIILQLLLQLHFKTMECRLTFFFIMQKLYLVKKSKYIVFYSYVYSNFYRNSYEIKMWNDD